MEGQVTIQAAPESLNLTAIKAAYSARLDLLEGQELTLSLQPGSAILEIDVLTVPSASIGYGSAVEAAGLQMLDTVRTLTLADHTNAIGDADAIFSTPPVFTKLFVPAPSAPPPPLPEVPPPWRLGAQVLTEVLEGGDAGTTISLLTLALGITLSSLCLLTLCTIGRCFCEVSRLRCAVHVEPHANDYEQSIQIKDPTRKSFHEGPGAQQHHAPRRIAWGANLSSDQ